MEMLDNTTEAQKDQILVALFSFAFEDVDGKIDFDKEISGGDFVELFSQHAGIVIAAAEETQKKIDETLKSEFEEFSLDEEIQDSFGGQASNINNGGTATQVQYLILKGHTPASIASIAEG